MKNFFGIILFFFGFIFFIDTVKNPDDFSWWVGMLAFGIASWGLEMIITDLIDKKGAKLKEEFEEEIKKLRNEMEDKYDDITPTPSHLLAQGEDELYKEAEQLVVEAGKASTSFLQRKLGIGYSRSARIINMMEARGVISSGREAQPRTIL